MSSERDQLRFSVRRELLYQAVRDSDTGAAARAAARLRVNGFPLTAEEFERAAEIRRTIGIALLKARLPGHAAPRRAHKTPLLLRPASNAAWRAVAAAAVLALVVLLLWNGSKTTAPGGGSPPQVVSPQQVAPIILSRGRTITAVEVAVAVSPTPEPSPSASAEPSASAAPVSTASASTPGSGGTGTGSGGGSGSGSGSGSGAGATITPAPTATPVVVPAGFSRLNIIVYDFQTLRPLAGACVVIGTILCGPNSFTDANGRWSADVAASSASTRWDMYFTKAGYATQHTQITLPGGVSRTYTIYLRRTP